uniref:Transmembrane protein 174 n=1 Tax=Salvator merianae TaxID=96440 RepID=A0A8D0BQL6_SALMN
MERDGNAEDFSINVFSVAPQQRNSTEVTVSDDDKAGATLLFSGVFLGLVGMTFTVMGWVKHEGMQRFDWTQMLGPILLSVGVTFLLIAVRKFKMFTCTSCNQSEERVPDLECIPSGQSFVFAGISQPITFHGATVMQYLPPHASQEDSANFQPVLDHSRLSSNSGSTMPASNPPCNNNANSVDNAIFSVDGNHSTYLTVDSRIGRSSDSLEESEEMLDEDLCNDVSPPAYDKLFPQPSS